MNSCMSRIATRSLSSDCATAQSSVSSHALSIGYLRRLTVETYRRAYRDQNGIILFWRMGLARYTPTGTASGIEWAAVLRDW